MCIWKSKQFYIWSKWQVQILLKVLKIWDNIDRSGRHYTKWNKSVTAWFYLYEISKLIKLVEIKIECWLPEGGGRGKWGVAV